MFVKICFVYSLKMVNDNVKDGDYYLPKLMRMIFKIERLYEEINILFKGYHMQHPLLYKETIRLSKDIQSLLRNQQMESISLELFNFCCKRNIEHNNGLYDLPVTNQFLKAQWRTLVEEFNKIKNEFEAVQWHTFEISNRI